MSARSALIGGPQDVVTDGDGRLRQTVRHSGARAARRAGRTVLAAGIARRDGRFGRMVDGRFALSWPGGKRLELRQ